MKHHFSHIGLRTQLEYLNIAVGAVLILISFIYFSRGMVESFASWFVFGCMYMVMDKYWHCDACTTRKIADTFKYCVNILAFFVSICLLVYVI